MKLIGNKTNVRVDEVNIVKQHTTCYSGVVAAVLSSLIQLLKTDFFENISN
jgi:hypothetical protein